MAHTLICGSMAFDTIMSFYDRFSNAILPDQLHTINVAFLVPELRKEWGGCAGNIAYNLKLLNEDPKIMATVGIDGEPYLDRLRHLTISTEYIQTIPTAYTAQAFITTDKDNNQITAFHPGAMTFAHENKIANAQPIKLAIIAPDGRDAMLTHARDCHALNIPFIFDPGQGLPMFNENELSEFANLATYIAMNDYEAKLFMQRTNISIDSLRKKVSALIITNGHHGSDIYTPTQHFNIPCVTAEKVVDPTGCGDAFRAGILYGLQHHLDWETTGRLASLMGAIKVAHRGGQNHTPSFNEIQSRFKSAFGYDLKLNH
jgi:adenosine kinase